MTGKKKYIVIQRGSSEECSSEESWYDLKRVKAYVAETKGDEQYALNQYSSVSSHVFRMDYFEDVTTVDRIRMGGKHFDIIDVDNSSEYGVFTRIYAVEYGYEN